MPRPIMLNWCKCLVCICEAWLHVAFLTLFRCKAGDRNDSSRYNLPCLAALDILLGIAIAKSRLWLQALVPGHPPPPRPFVLPSACGSLSGSTATCLLANFLSNSSAHIYMVLHM